MLKVGHHGSETSTGYRFLYEVLPAYAVISVGENNYGHPSADTLEKLAAAGAKILQTRQCGAITLKWRDGAWKIDTFLEAPNEVE